MEELLIDEYHSGRKPYLYKYRDYIISENFLDQLKDLDSFEVREDDVWVLTFPKSGTTWVQEIVYLLMNDLDTDKASKTTMERRFPFLELHTPGPKIIAKMPSPRLIKTHLPFSLLPDQWKEKKPKIIYVLRNPKDVVVSYFSFTTKFFKGTPFNGTFEDFSRLFIEGKVASGPWCSHVTEAWKMRNESHVLFLTYEDLQRDPYKNVKEIATFLDKPVTDEQASALVKHCSFDNMKQNNSVNFDWLKDIGVANKDVQFMRKGKVGDWKNHLSEDIAKKFDDMVATKLPPEMAEFVQDSLPDN